MEVHPLVDKLAGYGYPRPKIVEALRQLLQQRGGTEPSDLRDSPASTNDVMDIIHHIDLMMPDTAAVQQGDK